MQSHVTVLEFRTAKVTGADGALGPSETKVTKRNTPYENMPMLWWLWWLWRTGRTGKHDPTKS